MTQASNNPFQLSSETTNAEVLWKASNTYIAPLFQRQYVWDVRQLKDFITDIDYILEDGAEANPIFMGAIVAKSLDREPSIFTDVTELWVVDGQQRLTTIYLFYLATIVICQENGFDNLAQRLAENYILHSNLHPDTAYKPKLKTTFQDQSQFTYLLAQINAPNPVAYGANVPIEEPKGLLVNAFKYLKDYLTSSSQNHFESEQNIHDFLFTVMRGLEFTVINLMDSHDVYTVFERLNSKGEDLEVMDLIRNLVFTGVENIASAEDINDRFWQSFENGFEEYVSSHSSPENITGTQKVAEAKKHRDGFFFPYGQTIQPAVTKAKLFQTIKNHWNEKFPSDNPADRAQKSIDHMRQYLSAYNLITRGKTANVSLSPGIEKIIKRLFRMGIVSATHTYLYELIHTYLNSTSELSEQQCIDALKFVESFLVRRAILGIEPTGVKALFQTMWPECGADTNKMLNKVAQSSTQSFPTNDELRDGVLNKPLYRRSLANYIVSEYEYDRNHNALPGSLPKVELDHICPQSRSGEWLSAFTDEDYEKYLHTWANLVPLSHRDNSAKNASSWAAAKAIYQNETTFKTTTDVATEYSDWNVASLKERAESLYLWAKDFWPYPGE